MYRFVRLQDAPPNSPPGGMYAILAAHNNVLQVAIEAETAGVANVRESQYAGGAAANGTTDDYPVLHAADLAGIGMTYIGPGHYRLASNFKVDQPTYIADGAQLVPDAGVTVTFTVMPRLPDAHCFAGAGVCTFQTGVASHLKSIWWGSSAAATAALANLDSAVLDYMAGSLVPQHLTLTSETVSGTNPDSTLANVLLVSNASATLLTGFAGIADGTPLTLLFQDGNTTLVNSPSMAIADHTNLTGVAGGSITLLYSAGVWHELSRTGPTATTPAVPVTPTRTGVPSTGPGLGGNLVQNGDFSNGGAGWALSGTAVVDTNQADAPPSSSTCLSIPNAAAQAYMPQIIPVLPNTVYTVGGFVKSDGSHTAQIIGYPYLAGVLATASALGAALSTAATWTFVTHTFTTPGNCWQVQVAVGGSTGSGQIYIGRVGLVQGSTYTDAMFASNPLGNRSLVTCEATTNLLSDGDCEGVGGTITAGLFNDDFTNAAAWTTVFGGTATVTGNVLSIPASSKATAGHPNWWDTQASGGASTCQIRFQPQAGFTAVYLEPIYHDETHQVYIGLNGTSMTLYQNDNGTTTTLATSGSCAITAGTSYWFVWSRTGMSLTVAVHADGSVPSALIATLTATLTMTTFSTGAIAANAAAGGGILLGQMGGTAYGGVCQVSGPAPLAYGYTNSGDSSIFSPCALCWDKTSVFSGVHALSVALPNSTTAPVDGFFGLTSGIGESKAVAVQALTAYTFSCRAKASGFSAGGGAVVGMRVIEWNSAGAVVADHGAVGTTLTANSDWVPLVATLTTAATTAYVNVRYSILASTPLTGSGIAWFDACGIEQKAYPSLSLDPFPAYYVPTGARASSQVSIPLPAAVTPSTPWTMAWTSLVPVHGPLLAGAGSGDLWVTAEGNINLYQDGNGLQLHTGSGPSQQYTVLANPNSGAILRGVLTYDGAGLITLYCNGVQLTSGQMLLAPFSGSLILAANSVLLSGFLIGSHAWTATEISNDLANHNPPGLIVGTFLYLLPGWLYAQAPDASGNTLPVRPASAGRRAADRLRAGLLETGQVASSALLAAGAMVLDLGGYIEHGGLLLLASQAVGTSQTTIPHGLGRIPGVFLVTPRSNARCWQSAPSDATNLYLSASVAGTFDLYLA
ncbi:MAG TPA: carbohydrate binding domain-containing protein [Chloroflexota bacterium]|jgi:hypothetical protein